MLTKLDALSADQMNFGDTSDTSFGSGDAGMIRRKIHFYHKRRDFDDAQLSFDFSMRSLFTANGPLEDETKMALRNWLELLGKTMPHMLKIQRVTKEILDDFGSSMNQEGKLLNILDQFSQNRTKEWSASCTKGHAGTGYTCGLWKLFHIMSVRIIYSWNTTELMLLIFTINSQRPYFFYGF